MLGSKKGSLKFSLENSLEQACHITCCISDEDAILFEADISLKFMPKLPRKIFHFHKGDFASLKASLTLLASNSLSTKPGEYNVTVHKNWSYISQKILKATNNFIPNRIRTLR